MASDRVWANQNRRQVILDSSAVLMLFEFAIDLERELTRLLGTYHIVVPTAIVDELNLLATRTTGPKAQKAKASLRLIERFDMAPAKKGKTADDAVLLLALEVRGIVVTNDTTLRKRAKAEGLSVIFLRGKQQLVLE
ncbi:MAG: hypothetical protein JW771_03215 [Candidatus Thermoplasmatota archaeon]|nr:hypothetical protein [Candidatus Thermoplasmatota archaeon]